MDTFSSLGNNNDITSFINSLKKPKTIKFCTVIRGVLQIWCLDFLKARLNDQSPQYLRINLIL